MPLSKSPIPYYGAFIIALIPVSIGLGVLFYDPYFLLDVTKHPRPSSPTATDTKTLEAYLYFFGVRDLTLGCITLAIWQTGNRKILGMVIVLAMGQALGDGLVNRMQVPGSEWTHWPLIPVGLGIGTALLGWFD